MRARFIPTPVGNTFTLPWWISQLTVHPHARGEHRGVFDEGHYSAGSSPRPWGTRLIHQAGIDLLRFIPTPVGNTRHRPAIAAAHAVHPHARGEHRIHGIRRTARHGSSPRPWGTHHFVSCLSSLNRFIPTPVGNTEAGHLVGYSLAVHPHARGEHQTTVSLAQSSTGSSPRPWGTLEANSDPGVDPRFIPTPVGNTCAITRLLVRLAVHPHARGEHGSAATIFALANGSSPRPWGTLLRVNIDPPNPRFIPTPVGNTSCRVQ